MAEIFKAFAEYIALGLEVVAAILIALGALEAIFGLIWHRHNSRQPFARRKGVFLDFGVWLLLGLEFELGADIVRSAIAPSWKQIGELAAIAVIRTFLNYFLAKDVEKYGEPVAEAALHTGEATAALAEGGRLNARLG